jgi:hypothetical protein
MQSELGTFSYLNPIKTSRNIDYSNSNLEIPPLARNISDSDVYNISTEKERKCTVLRELKINLG